MEEQNRGHRKRKTEEKKNGFVPMSPSMLLREYKRKKKREARKLQLMKRKLSPEKYQEYMQKRRNRKIFMVSGTVIVCVLAVLVLKLVFSGIGRLVSGNTAADQVKEEKIAETTVEEENVEAVAPAEEKTITIGSTGCVLMHGPVIESGYNSDGSYDFSGIFDPIRGYFNAPDFMVCEFEGTLSGPSIPYAGYPSFNAPDQIVLDVRDSGVDLQLLANNHIYDNVEDGFYRTVSVFEENGIAHTGVRSSVSEKRYYTVEIEGIKVGFMNYVYETPGEAVHLNQNYVADEVAQLINTFDYDYLESFYSEAQENIADMKAEGVDFIIANMHWGTEYQLEEDAVQDAIAQRLCDMGVQAVIGGHPHCEQPIDVLTSSDGSRKTFVVYSVGNVLSNQRRELISMMRSGHTEDGAMVCMTLKEKSDGSVELAGVDLMPTWVYLDDNGKFYILPLYDLDSLEEASGLSGIRSSAQESYDRTMEVMGPGLEKAQAVFGKDDQILKAGLKSYGVMGKTSEETAEEEPEEKDPEAESA